MRLPWLSASRRVRYKPIIQVPFLGHEALQSTFLTHLRTAQTGALQLVTLAGESGSGKSALLTDFAAAHCTHPAVFLVQLNVADCWFEQGLYRQLFDALRTRSASILQTVYHDTRHLRKALTIQWDETEFRHMLTSTDWAPLSTAADSPRPPSGSATTPLAQLMYRVQEHPWAVGAATMLDVLSRGGIGMPTARAWRHQWTNILEALRPRIRQGTGSLVLILDQLEDVGGLSPQTDALERIDWRAFVATAAAHNLAVLVLWAGTTESLQPVHEALHDEIAVTQYHLDPLSEDAYRRLVQRTRRVVPRALRDAWESSWLQTPAAQAFPGQLLLATAQAVASAASKQQDAQGLTTLVTADTAALARQLLQGIQRGVTAGEALYLRVVEVCAFMPPGRTFGVEELLPLCDLDALGLDPVTARTQLEGVLGQWARHGLLSYNPYAGRYTTGHRALQEALQSWVAPAETVRREKTHLWRVTMTVLRQMQAGERGGMEALAQAMEARGADVVRTQYAPLLVGSLRRLLPACSKQERQQMAHVLGGFPSPLAVELLRLMLYDAEGQVRSGVAQALADLGLAETLPVLIEALRDANSDVRWIAAQALGRIPERTAVDALIPLLTDEDKEVSRIAAHALGQQGDRRAVPHLIAAVRENYPLLRDSAAQALGHLADQRALPALREVLQDAHPQVRRSAEAALARLTASS